MLQVNFDLPTDTPRLRTDRSQLSFSTSAYVGLCACLGLAAIERLTLLRAQGFKSVSSIRPSIRKSYPLSFKPMVSLFRRYFRSVAMNYPSSTRTTRS